MHPLCRILPGPALRDGLPSSFIFACGVRPAANQPAARPAHVPYRYATARPAVMPRVCPDVRRKAFIKNTPNQRSRRMDSHPAPLPSSVVAPAFARACPQHSNLGEVCHDPQKTTAGPPGRL